MHHMILWVYHEVMNHLDCFRVLDMDMFFLAHWLHEVLMNELSDLAPRFAIIHDQKMVTLSDQVGYEGCRSIAVDTALLIQQTLDKLAVRNHEGGICEPLQTEEATKFPSPFCQSRSCLAPYKLSFPNCTYFLTRNVHRQLGSGVRCQTEVLWAGLFQSINNKAFSVFPTFEETGGARIAYLEAFPLFADLFSEANTDRTRDCQQPPKATSA